jgi:glucose/mannose transport system permease protein
MLPLSLPAFVVVCIFQFTNIWNDFLFGVTILTDPQRQPVTVALNNLQGSYSVDWNVVMAGAITAALPTALVYIFLGRFFIRGLLAGSVKG